ncbi:MAG: hypothetical protein QNJ67_17360 [Kiloniellales bacterium]|nr:hypothetical protein [Kiloniellales bacterium]
MNDTGTTVESGTRRPISIAILAVLLVLYGLLNLIPLVLLLTSQEIYDSTAEVMAAMAAGGFVTVPLGAQIVIGFVASLVVVAGGAFVWQGRNWARWLVALWMAFSLVYYVLQTGFTWIPALKLPVFFLVLFLLFRPGVAAHFRRGA